MTRIERMQPDTWLTELEKWKKEAEQTLSLLRKEQNRQNNAKENKQQSSSPKVSVTQSHGKPQFFTREKENKKWIKKYYKKAQRKYAQQILQEEYINNTIIKLEKNIKLIEKFTTEYKQNRAWTYYENLPSIQQQVLTPVLLPQQTYLEKWEKEPYTQKQFYIDDLKHYTTKNEQVRSKSEVIIADTLNSMGIPYKYEKPLTLGNHTIHPDFTCLNPRTRKEIIWEHFGLMDDPQYAANSCKKLQTYQNSGLFLGQEIIISWETTTSPFTKFQAQQIASKYLT